MIGLLFFFFLNAHAAQDSAEIQEGAYLVRAAGCADCHTQTPGRPFAGGGPLVTPAGIFYPPNLTPDVKTGIGSWSEADLRRALREGRSPKGQIYYPTFPYRSFTKLWDGDIHKIYVYLRSLQPIEHESRPADLSPLYSQRWSLWFWQQVFFKDGLIQASDDIKVGYGEFQSEGAHSPTWNRGAYLVEAVMHCTECHTPRAVWLGLPVRLLPHRWMAGGNIPVGGKLAPNITPDLETGLGTWKRENWLDFLAGGRDPQGKYVGDEMAEVIQNSSALSPSDRSAIVEYLMSLTPVKNFVGQP